MAQPSPMTALAALPLFAGYDATMLAEIAVAVRIRRFRRGEGSSTAVTQAPLCLS